MDSNIKFPKPPKEWHEVDYIKYDSYGNICWTQKRYWVVGGFVLACSVGFFLMIDFYYRNSIDSEILPLLLVFPAIGFWMLGYFQKIVLDKNTGYFLYQHGYFIPFRKLLGKIDEINSVILEANDDPEHDGQSGPTYTIAIYYKEKKIVLCEGRIESYPEEAHKLSKFLEKPFHHYACGPNSIWSDKPIE